MRLSHTLHARTFRAAVLTLLAISMLGACAPASKKRTTGTVIDDQNIELKAIDALYATPEIDNADHIKVEVHNGTVLLAGETRTEGNKALASRIVTEIRGVTHVVNELAVMPAAGLGSRLDNSYITAKANSILTAKNPVQGMDLTRIKVVTARRNV
jgi:osmotically-inducible protein OsmY